MSDIGVRSYEDTRRTVVNAFLTTGKMCVLLSMVTALLIVKAADTIGNLAERMRDKRSGSSTDFDVSLEAVPAEDARVVGEVEVPEQCPDVPKEAVPALPESIDGLNQIFEPYGVTVMRGDDRTYEVTAMSVEGAEALVDDLTQDGGLYQQARRAMLDATLPKIDSEVTSFSLMSDLEEAGISVNREMMASSTRGELNSPLYFVRVPSTEVADTLLTDMMRDGHGRLYDVANSICNMTGRSSVMNHDEMSDFLGSYAINLGTDGSVSVPSTAAATRFFTDMLDAKSMATTQRVRR